MQEAIAALESVSALAVATPLGLLITLLIVALIWQSHHLGKEREISRLLVSDMLAVKHEGVSFSPRAHDVMRSRDRRVADKPRDPDRRRE